MFDDIVAFPKYPPPVFCPLSWPFFVHIQPMTEKVDIYRMGLVFKKFLANGGVHEVDSFADFQTMEHKSYNKVMTILIVGRSFKSFRIRPEKRWICKVESHLVEEQSTSKI